MLDKAIATLKGNIDNADCGADPYGEKAHQLGIEALERLSKLRNRKSSYTGQGLAEGIRHDAFNEFKQKAQEPLPSEDEERR